MKKYLLLSAATLFAAQGLMADNYLIENFYVRGISPDGATAVSMDMYTRGILGWDLVGNKQNILISPEEYSVESVSVGNGNTLGNGNNLVGTIDYGSNNEAFLFNGTSVNVYCTLDDQPTSAAEGITPDGKRICGYVGLDGMLSNIRPVYWDVNGDKFTMNDLPYPTKDFTGQKPQGVNAVAISADGKAIVGDIVGDSGMHIQPLVFLQGEDGKWSYKTFGLEFLNPDNVQLPECPTEPDAGQYMSAEDKAEYEANMAEWRKNPLGMDRPDPMDYITDADKKAAYQEALNKYNEERAKFDEALMNLFQNSNGFEQNHLCISPNGKYIGCTLTVFDEATWSETPAACIYNVETGELRRFDNKGYVDQVFDDGSALASDAFSFMSPGPQNSYMIPAEGEPVLLQDYVKGKSEDAYKFIQENLTHTFTVMDPETYEPSTIENYVSMGQTYMSADKTRIVGSLMAIWDMTPEEQESGLWCQGYTLELPNSDAIENINADLDNTNAPVEYFNLQGVRISEPQAGQIVIRRQGSESVKMIAR
jgi:hypothetical protein